MIGFNIADVTAISLGSIEISSIYAGNSVIWEDTPDYEKKYFTTVAKGSGNIGFDIPSGVSTANLTSISYSTDNGSTWTTTNNVNGQAINVTVPVNNGDKVLWKGVGITMTTSESHFTSTVNFDVEGNIMSLLNGDNFYQSTFNTNFAYQFYYLFYNTNVVDASNLILPATTLAGDCYCGMFNGCNSLTTAPELPATTLASGCYSEMFYGCNSLTTAPELPATTLAQACYQQMFYGCNSLTTAPELPVTTLANHCYSHMFRECNSLTTAPELPATTLAYGCYRQMFFACSHLNYIKMLATDISATDCLDSWVYHVAATGTFVKDANTTIPTGTSGIPTGWTVQNIGDYEQQYLTTVAKESGNIGFDIPSGVSTANLTSISYSTDNGSTWTTTNNVNSQAFTITVPVNNGDKVLWKGDAITMRDGLYGYAKFTTTIDYDVEGNAMSLLNGDNFYHSSFASSNDANFYKLFENTNVIDASNLILPATTLKNYCYEDMFKGCTKLTAAPKILPATTLAQGCYKSMFHQCGLLTTAPELPATNLVDYCYQNMFEYCSNLNYIKMMATTNIGAYYCLSNWVNSVSATGTFVKDTNATIPTGASGIPSGWTVQDAA